MQQSNPSQTQIDAYALDGTGVSPEKALAMRGAWMLSIAFGAYAAGVTALTANGFFAAIDERFFALTVVATMSSLVLAYFKVPAIRAFAEWLSPYGLATFHIWRIPAALTFLYYGAQGWLPPIFVNLAGWGDMLAGVLAVLVIALPRSARLIGGFHLVGFADFLVAVGTGLTLQLIADPMMGNIAYLPVALIPLVGVPLSGASHIVAFHLMWRDAQNKK